MEIHLDTKDKIIRKIEDIIDIQRANGSIDVRQVSFKLPSDTDSNISAALTKSLESGLAKTKESRNKNEKKLCIRPKPVKKLMPDVISWPSDSDITVLRMKMRSKANVKDNVGNIISGDGLHQPDSSSMINLATLILQSQHPSKQSVIEELLLPLTSWEHAEIKTPGNEKNNEITNFDKDNDMKYIQATSSHEEKFHIHENALDDSTTKSKVARFLRLYFCPCCSCLYRIEKMQEDPSAYFTLPRNTKRV